MIVLALRLLQIVFSANAISYPSIPTVNNTGEIPHWTSVFLSYTSSGDQMGRQQQHIKQVIEFEIDLLHCVMQKIDTLSGGFSLDLDFYNTKLVHTAQLDLEIDLKFCQIIDIYEAKLNIENIELKQYMKQNIYVISESWNKNVNDTVIARHKRMCELDKIFSFALNCGEAYEQACILCGEDANNITKKKLSEIQGHKIMREIYLDEGFTAENLRNKKNIIKRIN